VATATIVKCSGCETEFPYDPARPNRKRCNPKCKRPGKNAARDRRLSEHDVQFIAVDGEGVDRWDQEEIWNEIEGDYVIRGVRGHEYVLLSVGDKSLHNNGKLLQHREIFAFLWDQFLANPKAAFVGFFLGYDFCQWLKSLPESRATSLLHPYGIAKRMPRDPTMKFPFPVRCGDWEFDILGAKRFKLRPYVKREDIPTRTVEHRDGTVTEERIARPWMYVCDAGSFFQSALMTAIDPKDWSEPIVTTDEFTLLGEGKKRRSNARFDAKMIEYNLLENDVLARLMGLVNKGFVADNILLNRSQWFGPGQAAQKWLANVGCPSGEEIRSVVPEYARDAGRMSYYGGWFEIFYHGIIPGCTCAYDINSAYPFAISKLPCLLHGTWTKGTGMPGRLRKGSLRLVDAEVSGNSSVIGAMPHRTREGSILRPRKTSGWYWWHEIQASRHAGLITKVKVNEWIDYAPCDCPPPLAAIAELYEGRLTAGKNSPFGKSKKLVYNSSYGKLAQSIGMPRFTNSIYASLITAFCRTMILEAIATHPMKANGVVMVATDSVVFLEPHPTLHIHETELGAWDEKIHTNLSLLMPGLYWDDVSRARVREGKAPKVKSRGVPARDLALVIDDFDNQWRTMADPSNWPVPWPKVKIPIGFGMISAKMAIHRNRWDLCGKVIYDGERVLNADPTAKRAGGAVLSTLRPGALQTVSWPRVEGEPRTTPYDKAFGEERRIGEESDLLTPEGVLSREIAHAIIP
jgi:hypothetical protein